MQKVEGYIFTGSEFEPYFDFWKEQQAKGVESFFFRQNHASNKRHRLQQHTFDIKSEDMSAIYDTVGENHAGVLLIFTSLFGVLLQKYTGETQIIIDTPLYKGTEASKRHVNSVPVIFDVQPQTILKDYLNQCQQALKCTYKYQNFPLGLIAGNSKERPFQTNVAIHFEEFHESPVETGYDLNIAITRHGSNYSFNISYSDAFNSDFITKIETHFKNIAGSLSTRGVLLSDINIMGNDEITRLKALSCAKTSPSCDLTLKDLFEERARTTPDAIALVAGNITLTYDQLNKEANKVANYISEAYLRGRNQIVGIVAGRNENLIIGMLAVLKAGGAYLPIDHTYPKARRELILSDAKVQLLITESDFMFDFENYEGAILTLDIERPELTTSDSNPEQSPSVTDLAYVIYTSGSTGMPKGVMIEHGSCVNMCLDQIDVFQIKPSDRVLQLASCSFDASVSEVFKTLLSGATLVMIEPSVVKEPPRLFRFLRDNAISVVTLPPSFLASIEVSELQSLRVVISAGEAAKPETASECVRYFEYYNAYGPTECSVCVSIQNVNEYLKKTEHDKLSTIPIGKPIANNKVFLLDKDNNMVPAGLPGEICVGGRGLARGYLYREELTSSRFIDNPFEGGTKIYKTGDIGRWMPTGELEFLGRKDDQVKVRGHRIEVGEVQHVLENIPHVGQAFVIAIESAGEKMLVAYYSGGKKANANFVMEKIKEALPHYMVPSHFVQVEEFPLTKQGKINRNLLPDPLEHISRAKNYIPPENQEEKEMADIWSEVLGHEQVGMKDDFFMLGGDSIKAIRLVGKINLKLNANIEVKDIFSHPDIERLLRFSKEENTNSRASERVMATAWIEELKKSVLASREATLLPSGWEDFYPASDIQVGMLYHALMDRKLGVFHDQMFHQIKDPSFDYDLFWRAVEIMNNKHEILRTSFDLKNFSHSLQIVHKANVMDLDVEFEDITGLSDDKQREYLQNYLKRDLANPFNMERAGLWRIRVFQLSQSEVGILLVFHHAIIDGWSDNSFSTELSNLYFSLKKHNAFEPVPLQATYKDYVIDQIAQKSSLEVKAFWERELKNFDGVALPFDKSPSEISRKGKSVGKTFFLEPQLADELNEFSKFKNIPLKHLLFGAFLLLIHKTTNNKKVCVGVVANGRPDKIDGDKVLGCFLNTVPFIQTCRGEETLEEFLDIVNQKCTQYKSYDKLSLPEIMKLGGQSGAGYSTMIDVTYNYVDFYITQEVARETEASEPIVNGSGNNPVPFAFSVKKINDNIRISMIFFEGLFSDHEANALARYFKNILRCVAEADKYQVAKLDILDSAEKEHYLKLLRGQNLEYPQKTLTHFFEQIVEKYPSNVAVVDGDDQLTYRELNERANALANYLRKNFKCNREDRIGVLVGRSEKLIVAILGIMKAGACVVPLAENMPEERINAILADAMAITAIVDDSINEERITATATTNLESLHRDFDSQSQLNPSVVISNEDLAYVIYTSGTTGRPKGVMVSHANILNTIKDQVKEFAITQKDAIVQLAAVTFDVAMYEIFMALLSGAKLVMVPKATIDEPGKFVDYIRRQKVSVMALTPGYLNLLDIPKLDFLRVMITGGEPPKMADAITCGKMFDYYNSFGPTECGVCVTTYKLDTTADIRKKTLPIGKPLSNTGVYIVDDALNIVPAGVKGEIMVQGHGVVRGYLNNPDLTSQKFIPNPYVKGTWLYRTGDLGKWNADGYAEFVGRNDQQLKVNGYRIEPGEIEIVLKSHPEVSDALVTVRDFNGVKNLVAYYASVGSIEIVGLRQHLISRLPGYMVPGFICRVEKFPLTENGKIDLKALMDNDEILFSGTKDFVAPDNQHEEEIATLWCEVLGIDSVSAVESFFDVGGTSLTLIRLFNKLSAQFGELKMADLFVYNTVRTQASFLNRVADKEETVTKGFNV